MREVQAEGDVVHMAGGTDAALFCHGLECPWLGLAGTRRRPGQ